MPVLVLQTFGMKRLRPLIGKIATAYLYAATAIILVVAPVGIVLLDPQGLWHGLGRLWAIYSPFNILNWLVTMAVLLPGLLLAAWAEKGR